MKKLILFTSISLFISLNHSLFAQDFNWVKSMGGIAADLVRDMTTDDSGNMYFTGTFSSTVDFDPGPNVFNLVSAGGGDIFVLKLSQSGKFVWVKQIGSTYMMDFGRSIKVGFANELYVCGQFGGTVDFDPNSGVHNVSANAEQDIFLLKLDTAGNFTWVHTFGDTGNNSCYDIEVGPSGSIYSTGRFEGTIDFDPGSGLHNLTSVNSYDIYIQKLDCNGNFKWAYSFGDVYSQYGTAITVDSSENVIVGGVYSGEIDFDPSPDTNNLLSYGQDDIFILKLDSSGGVMWAESFGALAVDYCSDIAVGPNNSILLSGLHNGTAYYKTSQFTGMGQDDAFLMKLNSSGVLEWFHNYGGTNDDFASRILVGNNDDTYLAGVYEGTMSVNTSSGIQNFTSNGQADIFFQKIDNQGNSVWIKAFGGFSNEIIYGLGQMLNGELFASGFFYDSIDFTGAGVPITLNSNGDVDIFLMSTDTLPTAINHPEKDISFGLYPNPTNGSFYLDFNNFKDVNYLKITNMLGTLLYSQKIIMQHQIKLDLDLAPGLYLVNVVDKMGSEYSRKLLVY